MSFTKEDIIAALKTVYDPEIPVNIWDLGLIYDIKIENKPTESVVVSMTMTSPTCPMSEEIMHSARIAITEHTGISNVEIELVWDPPWDISRMSETARLELDLTEQGW